MVHSELSRASPNAHLLIGQMPAPHQLHGPGWEGTGLSILVHGILFGILAYAATHVSQVAKSAEDVRVRLELFLDRPGAGREIGGDGPTVSDPAGPTRLIQAKPIEITPAVHPTDAPPAPEIVPVVTVQTQQILPGTMVQVDTRSLSRDAGAGGTGSGPGRGPGNGPGDGPGVPGARGEGVGSGSGVISPVLIKEVKPLYTIQAMRAKLQGSVEMEAVVLPNGTIDPASVRITRSLDSIFGLDEQAMLAVKQWRFRAGTFKSQPVPVRVTVELTFTLR